MGIGIGFNIGPVRFSTSLRGRRGGGGGGSDSSDDFWLYVFIGICVWIGFQASLDENRGFWDFVWVWFWGAFVSSLVVLSVSVTLAGRIMKHWSGALLGVLGVVHYWLFFDWVRTGTWEYADWTPVWIWVIGFGTSPLTPIVVSLLVKFLVRVARMMRANRLILNSHADLMRTHGLTSLKDLRVYLTKVEQEDEALKAANEIREETEKLRIQQLAAENKRAVRSELEKLHNAVQKKLNPNTGETITFEEMIQAFRSGQFAVGAIQGLSTKEQLSAREQIGKLAYLVLVETGWDVLAKAQEGPVDDVKSVDSSEEATPEPKP